MEGDLLVGCGLDDDTDVGGVRETLEIQRLNCGRVTSDQILVNSNKNWCMLVCYP